MVCVVKAQFGAGMAPSDLLVASPHTVQSDTTRCSDSRVGHPGRARITYRFYCVFNLSILLRNNASEQHYITIG
jgi:hypothetical protein